MMPVVTVRTQRIGCPVRIAKSLLGQSDSEQGIRTYILSCRRDVNLVRRLEYDKR